MSSSSATNGRYQASNAFKPSKTPRSGHSTVQKGDVQGGNDRPTRLLSQALLIVVSCVMGIALQLRFYFLNLLKCSATAMVCLRMQVKQLPT